MTRSHRSAPAKSRCIDAAPIDASLLMSTSSMGLNRADAGCECLPTGMHTMVDSERELHFR